MATFMPLFLPFVSLLLLKMVGHGIVKAISTAGHPSSPNIPPATNLAVICWWLAFLRLNYFAVITLLHFGHQAGLASLYLHAF